MKQQKFKIGDKVCWDGCPNEFRDNRHGTIVDIKDDIAFVNKPFSTDVRQVPLKILKHDERNN